MIASNRHKYEEINDINRCHSFHVPLFSQNISEGKDGLYYDSQGALYTGTYRNFMKTVKLKPKFH